MGSINQGQSIVQKAVGQCVQAEGGDAIPEIHRSPLQVLIPALLSHQYGAGQEVHGQAAHLGSRLLVKAVYVGEDLEQQEKIPLSGGKVKAPGTEIAAIRCGESGLP